MWQFVGQERAVALLQRSLEAGSVGHAYLIVGPPHVGKMTLALDLARALNCEAAERPCGQCHSCQKIASGNHPDVQIIGLSQNENSEAKLISIEQIRDVQHSASLPPFEGECKVFIIESAELLSIEAANCFLKTLEEPVARVVFLLLTTSDALLPQTVVSRCQKLELAPLAADQVEEALHGRFGAEQGKARLLARLSHGCLGWAIAAASDERLLQQRVEKLGQMLQVVRADSEGRFAYAAQLASLFSQSRATVQEVLDLWLDWWRDLLLVKVGCQDMVTNVDRMNTLGQMAEGYTLQQIRYYVRSIQAAGEQLRQNANARLALEVLMLDLPERENRAKVVVKDGG
jgi:DNA polymerase-3 subunit delta'